MKASLPNTAFEQALADQYGLHYVAGLDEAGRGALAGPVVAAAVILPLADGERMGELTAVNDSKQLSAKKRTDLYNLIVQHTLAYGIGSGSAQEIDDDGIIPATKRAMRRALAQLEPQAEGLVIDGRIRLATVNLPQQSIIRGDSKSLSIAAASILAKVTRDRHMIDLDSRFPLFNFPQHKGYGTEAHRGAIAKYGPTPIHRYTFAPIRQPLL
ncbi:MAG: ribonuclease HII [Chloroflexota bacterium]